MAKYYSIAADIRGKKCVVAGGGKVAFRKVKKLCDSGACVTVVADAICDEILALTPSVNILKRKYKSTDVAGAFLVFAATSDKEVNKQICTDAGAAGILANSVDGVEEGTFILPATCSKGLIHLGITTEGKAPVLSKALRKYFQEKLERVEEELIEEIAQLRRMMVNAGNETIRRQMTKVVEESVAKIIDRMEAKKKGEE